MAAKDTHAAVKSLALVWGAGGQLDSLRTEWHQNELLWVVICNGQSQDTSD